MPVGAVIVVLGGPAMLIGLGGGAASSLASGTSSEDLDFASVQRGNPEMQVQIERVQKKQRAAYESDMKKRQEEYARRGITQPDGISQQTRHKETNKSSNMLWFMFMISMMEQEMERSRATRMHFARAAA